MSWHLLEKGLEEIARQATVFGKLWVTFFFILRVIPLTRMGESVYGDEQAAFKCNVKQVGCENICFNQYSPISPVRFWGFQTVILATPPIIFLVFAAQLALQIPIGAMTKRKIAIMKEGSSNQHGIAKMNKVKSNNTVDNNTRRIKCQEIVGEQCGKEREIDVFASKHDVKHHFIDEQIKTQTAQKQHPYQGKTKSKAFFVNQENPSISFEEISLKELSAIMNSYNNQRKNRQTTLSFVKMYHELSLNHIEKTDFDQFICDGSGVLSDSELKKNRFEIQKTTSLSLRSEIVPLFRLIKLSDIEKCRENVNRKLEENNILFSKLKDRNTMLDTKINSINRKSSLQFSMCSTICKSQRCANLAMNTANQSNVLAMSASKMSEVHTQLSQRESSKNTIQKIKLERAFIGIAIAYFLQCVVRLILEIGFLYMQYIFFPFEVPKLYECQGYPCPSTVDCFISRSEEKSFMLCFMFSNSIFSAFLTTCEIFSLLYRQYDNCKRRQRARAKKSNETILKAMDYSKNRQLSSQKRSKQTCPGVLAGKKAEMGLKGGWLVKSERSGSSSNESGSFNSAELSGMFENDLEAEEVDENEDNDEDDGFD